MRHLTTKIMLMTAAVMLGMSIQAMTARAQFIQVYSPPAVLAPQPVFSYYPPATTYYAPPVTSYYAAPVTSYYAAPVTAYYPPTVNYSYYPPTTVYSAPVAVVPTVSCPGTVTTRSFVGYGVFRPRGVYTQSYYTPGGVLVP